MDKLADVFDVEITEVIPPAKPLVAKKTDTPVADPLEKDLLSDLQASRVDFDTIIELGKTALENVLSIADQGQHPRFYEAAAILIKNISDANKERLELHLKLSQIRKNQADAAEDYLQLQ